MGNVKPRLELTWIGKEHVSRVEPRILLEDPAQSYHAQRRVTDRDMFDNVLVQGDNLLALRALEQSLMGMVKCIYIDPPYNTGAAFKHYADGVEHSLWLSLMKARLELLKRLLAPAGVIFISIDDENLAHLKLLCDEVFGATNFCGYLVWEKKKKPSFINANMGTVTEFVVAYAKDRPQAPAFIAGKTTAGKKYPLNNAGNGIRVLTFPAGAVQFAVDDQVFEPQDMSSGNVITRLLDRVEVRGKRNANSFRLEGEWRYSQALVDELLNDGEAIVITKAPFRPNHIKEGGAPKKMKNLLSVAHYGMATYEDATAESAALFGPANAFDYPKPEKLIATLLSAVTEPGDLVLDSFAGSGTTAAVAHKLGRRWVAVEIGEHALTHCARRLRLVVDGADPNGITETAGWKGGGGFRFCRVAPSLLERDKWGNWVINKNFNKEMLAEAVCKLEGFHYSPSGEVFWMHGQSTERDFIFVTTQTLTHEQLAAISDEVGPGRSLLVCCSAFRAKPALFTNQTVKKIPAAVLARCEWGKDDYSLNVASIMGDDAGPDLPTSAATAPGTPQARSRKKRSPRAVQEYPLFESRTDA